MKAVNKKFLKPVQTFYQRAFRAGKIQSHKSSAFFSELLSVGESYVLMYLVANEQHIVFYAKIPIVSSSFRL